MTGWMLLAVLATTTPGLSREPVPEPVLAPSPAPPELPAAPGWVPRDELRPPIRMVEHPMYVDAVGHPVSWAQVRELSSVSDASGQVRRRKAGRTVLRVLFAGAAAAEAYGTLLLVRQRNWAGAPVGEVLARQQTWAAAPLGAQAALTGLCGVLMWTNAPSAWAEDRAIVLRGANDALSTARR